MRFEVPVMVVEYIRYTVPPDQAEQFERAYRRTARPARRNYEARSSD